MERLFELDDVTLLPSAINAGHIGLKNVTFNVINDREVTGLNTTLPIFTSPMECVVNRFNAKVFTNHGVRPVLPLSDPISDRLELCQWIFCSFSMKEVLEHFLRVKVESQNQFHINLDVGNGHDQNLIKLACDLKRLYQDQVIIMAGNIAHPEAYELYRGAGIDFMRVGISSGSLVDKDVTGFHYPMASLLEKIKSLKIVDNLPSSNPRAHRVKVIADGGMETPVDIIKALALGADYVMLGRPFAKVVEAAGPVYKVSRDASGGSSKDILDPSTIIGMEGYKAKLNGLMRQYYGNTSFEARARRAGYDSVEKWRIDNPSARLSDTSWSWVEIDKNISEWVKDFKKAAYYAFMMTSSKSWNEYKNNINYGIHG